MSGISTKDMSRISCVMCRSKKMKCDRQLPTCHLCETKHIVCEYPPDNKNMSQRSVQRRRKLGKLRYYGFNSVNHTLSEANKVFFNRDFEVEKERAGESAKLFSSTPVYKKYLSDKGSILSKVELVEHSVASSIYAELVDFSSLKTLIYSNNQLNREQILLLYSLILLSGRLEEEPFSERRSDLLEEVEFEAQRAPDTTEKIVSLILIMDNQYFLGNIETSWKLLFSATSICYALGMHEKPSKIWPILVFYDSIICSTIGRPTSIHSINVDSIEKQCLGYGEIAMLIRQTNEIFPSFNRKANLGRILELDERFEVLANDLKAQIKKQPSHPKEWELSLKLLLLTSGRIKLLFPDHKNHAIIEKQLQLAFIKFLSNYVSVLERLVSVEIIDESKTYFFKTQFSFVQCFCFQAFLLYFSFLSRRAIRTTKRNIIQRDSVHTVDPEDQNVQRMLQDISVFLGKRNATFKNIFFGHYMNDIFNSIESILKDWSKIDCSPETSYHAEATLAASSASTAFQSVSFEGIKPTVSQSSFDDKGLENWVSAWAQDENSFFLSPDVFPPR